MQSLETWNDYRNFLKSRGLGKWRLFYTSLLQHHIWFSIKPYLPTPSWTDRYGSWTQIHPIALLRTFCLVYTWTHFNWLYVKADGDAQILQKEQIEWIFHYARRLITALILDAIDPWMRTSEAAISPEQIVVYVNWYWANCKQLSASIQLLVEAVQIVYFYLPGKSAVQLVDYMR